MFERFLITVEVVPPASSDVDVLLASLESLADLPIDSFNVATNPVAKPRMSALALCSLIQQRTGKPAILHCTTRDHNRLSLQGLLWGAKALGIETILAMTGDFVALNERTCTTTVRDMNVFDLVQLSRENDLRTGVAFAYTAEPQKLKSAVHRLEKKISSGAQFVITQPMYDRESAEALARISETVGCPMVLGILPLRTFRHAEFLHQRVAGIEVPESVRERMSRANDALDAGISNARDMLNVARRCFAGVCIMPPFGHYEVLNNIL
jgi:homocysteine S-methyltransferase